MSYPWAKGWRRAPLDSALYSVGQQMAARGEVPFDHPVWKQTAKDEVAAALPPETAQVASGLLSRIGVDRPMDQDTDEGDPTPGGRCNCGARWSGLDVAHCAACHLTFTSVRPFDEHWFHGRCRTDAELRERGMEPNDKGWWRHPRPEGTLPGRSA